jgi:SAM-dependent methyltransferase
MERSAQKFDVLNRNKANFDEIYDLPDPREYFRVLSGLDYVIPDLAKGVFRTLIENYGRSRGRTLRVLDIGCSYGINAALIRFPFDLQRLANRYAAPRMHALDASDVVEFDSHYFRSWPDEMDAQFIGLDSSAAAVAYAQRVGLIESGISSNLEMGPPTADETRELRALDLIISTGCVGYITAKTFQRILALQDRNPPWVASFVLRMFPYDDIAVELERFGLVTEKLEGVTFVQRRFHSEDEYETTLSALRKRGVDPKGKEAEGLFHAEFFLSRPKDQVRERPLSELISVTSGESRNYGRRYRRISSRGIKLIR